MIGPNSSGRASMGIKTAWNSFTLYRPWQQRHFQAAPAVDHAFLIPSSLAAPSAYFLFSTSARGHSTARRTQAYSSTLEVQPAWPFQQQRLQLGVATCTSATCQKRRNVQCYKHENCEKLRENWRRRWQLLLHQLVQIFTSLNTATLLKIYKN